MKKFLSPAAFVEGAVRAGIGAAMEAKGTSLIAEGGGNSVS